MLHPTHRPMRLAACVLSLLTLFACGGGGGTTTNPPAPPPARSSNRTDQVAIGTRVAPFTAHRVW